MVKRTVHNVFNAHPEISVPVSPDLGTGFGLKNSGRELRELTELKGISPLKGS